MIKINATNGTVNITEPVQNGTYTITAIDKLSNKQASKDIVVDYVIGDINDIVTGWMCAKGGYNDKNIALFKGQKTGKSEYDVNVFQKNLDIIDEMNYEVEDDGENFIIRGKNNYYGEKTIPYVRYDNENNVKETAFFVYSGTGVFNSGSSVACQQYDYLIPTIDGEKPSIYAKWDKWECSVESATTSNVAKCGINMNSHDDDFQQSKGKSGEKIAMQTYYNYNDETELITGGTALNTKKWISPHFANSSSQLTLPSGSVVTIHNFRLYYKENLTPPTPQTDIVISDDNTITVDTDDTITLAYLDENEQKLNGYADIF